MLKCIVACWITAIFFEGSNWFIFEDRSRSTDEVLLGIEYWSILPYVYAGLGAILGHCFPVMLKFRGGKGVSCAIALIIMIDWRIALIVFGSCFILFLITRYISVGSLSIVLVTPFVMYFFGHKTEAIAVMCAIAVIIWIMHRGNIKKIVNGTERKFF